jgi:pimeloyl-ACP methyl ester carboxylesterase
MRTPLRFVRARCVGLPLAALVVAASLAATPALRAQAPALEHLTVRVDGHPMAVWARRPAHPRAAILFVHGRTWSARPDFDLQVSGEPRSVLEKMAAKGYAAYAVDLRAYGGTPADASGWNTPDQAAQDVAAVLDWIHKQAPSLRAPVLFGWSNGSTLGQLVAQRWPDRMSALVLIGYWWNPDSTIARDTTSGAAPKVANTAEAAGSDFITPAVIDARVKEAYIRQSLVADPYYSEWWHRDQYNALDPAAVHVPTLLLEGEFDPIAPTKWNAAFFTRLGTAQREWVVIAGADHAAILESTQDEVLAATDGFVGRMRARSGN